MSTTNLILGLATTVAIAVLATIFISQRTAPLHWVVEYMKPTGPYENAEFEGGTDPSPETPANEFLADLAGRCSLDKWTIEYNEMTDVNESARLVSATLSEKQQVCLRSAGSPPFLTIKQAYN